MLDSIKISALIPTYNRGNTIGGAIDSVLAQEFPAAEIIIVDDGSMDSTKKVVMNYGLKCQYAYQENSGVSVARNQAVRKASGDWIAFLDSDDFWVPQHLARLAEAIRATNGEAALYFCDAENSSGSGVTSYWESSGFQIGTPYVFEKDASSWAALPVQPMLLQASVIKRASYWSVGGLPPGLRTREDTLLFFKLGLIFPACAVSGRGTIRTADGAGRLTCKVNSSNLSYWEATLSVYREMLVFAGRFRPEYRRFFIDRLSASYFSLGRLSYRKRKPFVAMTNLIRSAGSSPLAFARSLRDSLVSHLARK